MEKGGSSVDWGGLGWMRWCKGSFIRAPLAMPEISSSLGSVGIAQQSEKTIPSLTIKTLL